MLYNRACSLIVGQDGAKGLELASLRIAFSIQKGSTTSPNKAEVKIWNASPETRELLEAVGNVVILKVGYTEDLGPITIFMGDVTRSLTVRDGPDWVTELELQDGFSEFRDMKASLSFAPGATTSQIVQNLASRFGLPVRPFPSDAQDKQYASGFAFAGRLRDAMTKVCDYAGLEWSIQNREIQVIKKGGVLKKRAFYLSSDTGMIGSPMSESRTMTEKAAAKLGFTAKQTGVVLTSKLNREGVVETMLRVLGYKVKTLLQPLIEPGALVQLKSKSINGEFFRVEQLTHSGDTHGADWHTEVTLRFLNG